MQNASAKIGRRPKIIVSDIDFQRLSGLAASGQDRFAEVAEVLQAEMDRADVRPAAAVPAGVVQMGSTVAFRSDRTGERRVTLVYPGEADVERDRISVLTPIGAALIGLSVGQSIPWTARDGSEHRLTVIAVDAPAPGGNGS